MLRWVCVKFTGVVAAQESVRAIRHGDVQRRLQVLIDRATDKIVGMHVLGVHAGEIIQGFGMVVKYCSSLGSTIPSRTCQASQQLY